MNFCLITDQQILLLVIFSGDQSMNSKFQAQSSYKQQLNTQKQQFLHIKQAPKAVEPSVEIPPANQKIHIFNHKPPNSHQNAYPQFLSEIQQKSLQHRLQIRRKKTFDFQQKIRQELMSTQMMDDLLQKIPKSNQQTIDWAQQLFLIYSKSNKYQIESYKIVELFHLVQKFPNINTLQMLHLIIMKSNIEGIHSMFQYDVMKLLHNIIVYPALNGIHRLSCNQEENIRRYNYCNHLSNKLRQQNQMINKIVQEAVFNRQSIQNLHQQAIGLDNLYFVQLDLVKTSLNIISELCKKSQSIRNFAILNHKSFTYCLKAYKHFGQLIKIQFYCFMEAASEKKFFQFDQQFSRLSKKIKSQFFLRWRLFITQQKQQLTENSQYLQQYSYLVKSMTNLLRMQKKWIYEMIDFSSNSDDPDIIEVIIYIVRHCTYLSSFMYVQSSLLSETLSLAMVYLQKTMKNEIKIEQFYYTIIATLRQSLTDDHFSNHLKNVRKPIYFILSNFFVQNQMSIQVLENFIIFDRNQPFTMNFINLLSNLLQVETDSDTQSECLMLLTTIFRGVPFTLVQPLILNCQIFSNLFARIFEEGRYFSEIQDLHKQIDINKQLIISFFRDFLIFVESINHQKFNQYKYFIIDSNREKLNNYANSSNCSKSIGIKIDQLLILNNIT